MLGGSLPYVFECEVPLRCCTKVAWSPECHIQRRLSWQTSIVPGVGVVPGHAKSTVKEKPGRSMEYLCVAPIHGQVQVPEFHSFFVDVRPHIRKEEAPQVPWRTLDISSGELLEVSKRRAISSAFSRCQNLVEGPGERSHTWPTLGLVWSEWR